MRDTQTTPVKKGRVAPSVVLTRDAPGSAKINLEGDISHLSAATGSDHVLMGLLYQLAALGSPGKTFDVSASNFSLGLIDTMRPRDAVETLLVTQMAVVHQATMLISIRLNQSDNLLQQDASARALTKLARTYATQMDALKRYRSEIQQGVRVEHVTVEAGAQAVVGNLVTGGRANCET